MPLEQLLLACLRRFVRAAQFGLGEFVVLQVSVAVRHCCSGPPSTASVPDCDLDLLGWYIPLSMNFPEQCAVKQGKCGIT